MTACKKGDIVLVPFPFSNQTIHKKRPAVVISSDNYNNISSDIVIIAVTSQTSETYGIGECLIEDWRLAGLLKPSAIKPAISTIEQSLVLKKLGKIRNSDMSKIILMMERLQESKKIEYYCVDFILFDPKKHIGNIQISFWGK